MAEIVHFIPKHNLQAAENLAAFIKLCREELTVFGAKLDWNDNHWINPGVAFGNLDQKSRILDPNKVMKQPFLDFAKAYFRYQQGHNPTKSQMEMVALKCIERALLDVVGAHNLDNLNHLVMDRAAIIAKEYYSPGVAYHTGREISRLANFLSDKNLISGRMGWKNPIQRPIDTVRTGAKAKAQREKKLPNEELLNALADIFANNPSQHRDIFTSSVSAMLLCAPSRVSEILTLSVDCEVWQTKRDGSKAYGWRFQPGKGGAPCIKWIPDSMVSLAQEAILRIRNLTNEARLIAKWYEEHQSLFYRHKDCPVVPEDQPLTFMQIGFAIGMVIRNEAKCRDLLLRLGVNDVGGIYSLAVLNNWIHTKLPTGFPWFDKGRGLRFSEALFCLQAKQLRTDMTPSPVIVWRPTPNTLNDDLSTRESSTEYFAPGIFDRHGFNKNRAEPLKANSHQFRHLLNTMAQRGGLSQAEIARWSGRADMKQNRVYDHMSEFELVDMIRTHDNSLILDKPLEELAEQIAAKIPMTRQEFNTLAIPTAHVTEYGFCIHDFTMSPCHRFRDCLNCTEQVCVKGDKRIDRLKDRHAVIKELRDKAAIEIAEGSAGADRWFEIHDLTEKRLVELIAIMEDKNIPDGSLIKLRNDKEFSPLRRAVEAKVQKIEKHDQQQPLLEDLRNMLGGGLG